MNIITVIVLVSPLTINTLYGYCQIVEKYIGKGRFQMSGSISDGNIDWLTSFPAPEATVYGYQELLDRSLWGEIRMTVLIKWISGGKAGVRKNATEFAISKLPFFGIFMRVWGKTKAL